MKEAGLYDVYKRWTLDFVRAMFVRKYKKRSVQHRLAWQDVDGVFFVLAWMLALAVLVLLGEHVRWAIRLRRTRRRRLAWRANRRIERRMFG